MTEVEPLTEQSYQMVIDLGIGYSKVKPTHAISRNRTYIVYIYIFVGLWHLIRNGVLKLQRIQLQCAGEYSP
jgi:hypothetical protein